MDKLLETLRKHGARKLALAVYMFTLLSGLLAAKVLANAIFGQLTTALIIAAFAANAIEHHAKK